MNSSMDQIGADLVVRELEFLGVRIGLGIPGGPLSGIFQALSQSKTIQFVLSQHETTAAFMAMGYYLFSEAKTLPVVCVTSGPGLTNLVTGLASAHEERVPIFVISGNISESQKGMGAMQDSFDSGINAIQMLQPITAGNHILKDLRSASHEIKHLARTAIEMSMPVHLMVPADIAHQPIPRLPSKKNPCLSEVLGPGSLESFQLN